MKASPPHSFFSRFCSGLLGFVFGTSFLGFLALTLTLYAYGELQNWKFLWSRGPQRSLEWQEDFVNQLHRCNEPPSRLLYCKNAVAEVERWLELEERTEWELESSQDLKAIQARAQKLTQVIHPAYRGEATLRALQAWFQQIDPYARLSFEDKKISKKPDWILSRFGDSAELRILSFGSPHLCQQLKPVLIDLENDLEITNLKVNLNDNPGGLIESALCLTDLFVSKGLVLAEFSKVPQALPFEVQERNSLVEWVRQQLGIKRFYRRSQEEQVFSKSLEIIINRGSASAAELMAASLKDLGRAKIIGERSYGKNTVQLSKSISGLEGVRAMLTVYEWYRPMGGSIRSTHGLIPDEILEL